MCPPDCTVNCCFSFFNCFVAAVLWTVNKVVYIISPIWTKFGSLMQSDMPSTVMWSKSKLEVKFQYVARLFFQSASRLRYVDEIWFTDSLWRSVESHIIKCEAESSMKPPVPPSWKCIWRHYSAASDPICTKFGRLVQNSTPTIVEVAIKKKKEF